ncbi:hypothetical protein J4E93_003257 [Alternaria ventricosa]|uniref:uncharacterized protein n=1 Tax=Alternaria ventricosa TaxID=1187951 RepID=UPI0020C593C8|nr:uncharacterized protein J4E93_003257 [Alternaria ventricosa]KAI4650900.1 hypothetical protein J4E93_003257 [Alternaria ventricosa]
MQDDDDRSDSFEEDLEGDKYLQDPNLSIAGSPRDDGNTAVLAFKILIATPLLAVSKATNEEVTKVLTITKKYYERLLLASIYLHRIASPSAALIDLWASCEFVLLHDYGKSIFFLKDLPDSLKYCVRRLVLPYDFLSVIAYSRWTKEQSRGGALFTNWISENFPNLRTVAIEVPDVCEVMEMNWNEASDYLCEMLKNGRLDTVRFYYKNYENGVDVQDWLMILDMMYTPEVADEDQPVPDELYEVFWHDPNGRSGVFSDRQDVILTYKIFMSTPLLLVSKEVNREAERVLQANKRGWINYYNEVARSNIHCHRIIKPTKAFQYLWSRSQVVLENTTADTMFFLRILPEVLKKSLHSLIITKSLMDIENEFSIALLQTDEEKGGSFMSNLIKEHYPNLRTVALEIPSTWEEMRSNLNNAFSGLCNMLKKGELDILRYFFKEACYSQSDGWFLIDVDLEGWELSDDSDDYEVGDDEISERYKQPLDGVEESISPISIGSEVWRDLGMERVVKITRSQIAAERYGCDVF